MSIVLLKIVIQTINYRFIEYDYRNYQYCQNIKNKLVIVTNALQITLIY